MVTVAKRHYNEVVLSCNPTVFVNSVWNICTHTSHMHTLIHVFIIHQIDQDLTRYWHNSMEYILVVTVDLLKTCQVMKVSPSPSDILHNHVASRSLLKRSCDVLLELFRSEQLPWMVWPCTWSQLQEENIQIR